VIARTWHGATRPEHADAYAAHLRDRILPELAKLPGCAGAFVMRRPGPGAGDEVAYAVMTLWFSEHAVREFAGDDVEAAVVPPEALALLSSHDERALTTSARGALNNP
jgi:heme-degrading monooxygenase HmoA